MLAEKPVSKGSFFFLNKYIHAHIFTCTHTHKGLCYSITSTGSPSMENVMGPKTHPCPRQINADSDGSFGDKGTISWSNWLKLAIEKL